MKQHLHLMQTFCLTGFAMPPYNIMCASSPPWTIVAHPILGAIYNGIRIYEFLRSLIQPSLDSIAHFLPR